MVKIAIVEDEKHYADTLLDYLAQYRNTHQTEYHVDVFTNGLDFLNAPVADFDIVFIDISMPVMNGMEVARQLRQVNPSAVLIFVTQMTQYAVKGYEVDAMDYIVKPVSYAHFALRLAKALRLLENRDAWYMIQTKDGLIRLQVSSIYYVESQEHYMVFYSSYGEFRTRTTMKTVEEFLRPHHFSRPNNSFLLNLRYVQSISHGTVELHGQTFSISRSKKKSFFNDLTLYLGGRIVHD